MSILHLMSIKGIVPDTIVPGQILTKKNDFYINMNTRLFSPVYLYKSATFLQCITVIIFCICLYMKTISYIHSILCLNTVFLCSLLSSCLASFHFIFCFSSSTTASCSHGVNDQHFTAFSLFFYSHLYSDQTTWYPQVV